MWYSSEHLLEEIEGDLDLGLYILSDKEQPLSFSKLLPMSNILSIRSMTISMSEAGVKLLELLAIEIVEYVIFPNSLIGATIQDGGKRERSIFATSLYRGLDKNSGY